MYIEWQLTKGQWALVDIEDWPKIEEYNWQAGWNPYTKSFYALTSIRASKRSNLYMHRLILGLASGNIDKRKIDHINHNTLDNRRENLRIVTNQQNGQNRKNTKGYYWNNNQNKWHVQMRVNGKTNHVGYYHTEEAARLAYLNAREEYGYIDSPDHQLTLPKINIIKQEASTA